MRHYCLGGCSVPSVCARRSRPVRGGLGRYLVLCLPFFPLPAPRVPRCVWRAVPSGCPLSPLAGTPFNAVCAFRALGPVALLVVPACPFRVCARALAVSAPRWVVWRAHLAWSRHWALVGPFHVVRAPPRVLPRSRAPSGVPWGGAVRSRFPPTWLGVVGAAAGRPRGGAFVRCVGRSGSCAPLPPTARPLGGLSGSALRACGCGGPALFLRGGRVVSTWCPGAGPPDSHYKPDAHGASPCGMRGGVGVTVVGVVHQCSGSWPSRAPLPRAYS